MPWKSTAQERWGNSPSGHKALGDAGVAEWNAASEGKSLPKKAGHMNHTAKAKAPAMPKDRQKLVKTMGLNTNKKPTLKDLMSRGANC